MCGAQRPFGALPEQLFEAQCFQVQHSPPNPTPPCQFLRLFEKKVPP